MIGPLVLLDEEPLPASIEAAMIAQSLIAPAHWLIETSNMLLVARRRGRIDTVAWDGVFGRLEALRVAMAPAADWRTLRAILRLADDHGLTAYDAAYLQLAIAASATLASLDGDLVAAARRANVPVLTTQ